MAAERRPAAQYPRDTITALATALGVHRNSCGAWAAEGAPAGPPYCELAWRTWASAHGHDLDLTKAPPEQALLELLANAGVPLYRRFLEQQRGPAAPPAGGGGDKPTAPLDWTQENKRLDYEQKKLDLDKQRRRLIHIDDLHRLVEAIAKAGASVLDDAPRLAGELPLGPDDRQRCQGVIETELAKRRAALVENLRARLVEFLEKVS